MPTPTRTRAKTKPKGKPAGGLDKLGRTRVAGLPLPLVLGGVVLAVAVGLYIRHRSAISQTAAAAVPASGQDTSGGAGAAAATPTDLSPLEDLAQSLYALTGYLGAGGSFGFGTTSGGDGSTNIAPVDTTSPATAPTYVYSPTYVSGAPLSSSPTSTSTPGASPPPPATIFDAAAAALSGSYDYAGAGQISPSTGQVSPGQTSYPVYTGPGLTAKVSTTAPTTVYSTSDPGAYTAQFDESPQQVPQAPSEPVIAAVTPPYYGVTYGPTAGTRASSNTKQGVYTVH